MTDLPDLLPASLTPVQRRRLEASLAIDDTPAERVSFQHTVLCQTCLPYRDPGPTVRVWQRQQGAAFLRLEAGAIPDPQTRTDTAGEITARRQTQLILCIMVESVRAEVLFLSSLAPCWRILSRKGSAPANSPAVSPHLCRAWFAVWIAAQAH